MLSKGLAGVTATKDYVIVSGREVMDSTDAWTCYHAATGKEAWKVLNPTMGQLDYGNSPRASPLIVGKNVILSSAFGQLLCVELATGNTVWDKDIVDDFAVKDKRKWGHCSTPLLVDGKLIINPGGKAASVVALNPANGKVLWKTPGGTACYGNLIAGTFGGKKQIVGFDGDGLNGWEVGTGKRLWQLKPKNRSDFNVPTPIAVKGRLLVAWENNGTFLFGFKKDGTIDPKPQASYAKLAPDTHTPVVVGERVFGAWHGLHCLDLKKGLKQTWFKRETGLSKYLTLVASKDRVLAVTLTAELILLDPRADTFKPISRVNVLKGENGCYSHPAFVGTRMYLRGETELVCVELKP